MQPLPWRYEVTYEATRDDLVAWLAQCVLSVGEWRWLPAEVGPSSLTFCAPDHPAVTGEHVFGLVYRDDRATVSLLSHSDMALVLYLDLIRLLDQQFPRYLR